MKLKPNFEKAGWAPSKTSLAIRNRTTAASTAAAAQIKRSATSPKRSARLREGLCRLDRASFSDAVPAGGVALIAANVEEGEPYRRGSPPIFTRLKQLGVRRDRVPIRAWRGAFLAPGAVYPVVTDLLPILFTR